MTREYIGNLPMMIFSWPLG